jgi:hypothetical protein
LLVAWSLLSDVDPADGALGDVRLPGHGSDSRRGIPHRAKSFTAAFRMVCHHRWMIVQFICLRYFAVGKVVKDAPGILEIGSRRPVSAIARPPFAG